jgi:hypothetical protein
MQVHIFKNPWKKVELLPQEKNLREIIYIPISIRGCVTSRQGGHNKILLLHEKICIDYIGRRKSHLVGYSNV